MKNFDPFKRGDPNFRSTIFFVLGIAVLGFGTLASLALEAPVGILFALVGAFILAMVPFVAGWMRPEAMETETPAMEMGGFAETPIRERRREIEMPPPIPGEPPRPAPPDQHP